MMASLPVPRDLLFPATTVSSSCTSQSPCLYSNDSTALCDIGTLNGVEGKVVLCERGGGIGRIAKGEEVKRAGGAAMILMNQVTADGYSTLVDAHVLPATHLSYVAGESIKEYINSTSTPMATILLKGTVIGDKNAPAVSSFSSRGPSLASTRILKPDIIGPSVSILAVTTSISGFNLRLSNSSD